LLYIKKPQTPNREQGMTGMSNHLSVGWKFSLSAKDVFQNITHEILNLFQ